MNIWGSNRVDSPAVDIYGCDPTTCVRDHQEKDNSLFDYDWFHGHRFDDQHTDAKMRCALRRFPKLERETAIKNKEFSKFFDDLKTRTLIYLRDGFSYEFRELSNVDSKSNLTFECEPVDDQYKVGAFIISVPFEDIVRVEVFAVPPDEMPVELPPITGFRGRTDGNQP